MNRRILITGASRGFGAALGASLTRRGHRVFAGVRGSHDAPGVAGTPVALDVTSDESVRAACATIAAEVAALDVVVNNAAIRSATVMRPIEEIDFRDVARTLDTNSIGPLRVMKAFLPLLRRGNAPSLVNVSSEAGSLGQCWRDREFDYCMSKAALNMATVLIAKYLRGAVRVVALHPGWLRTDMGGPNAALDPVAVADDVAGLIGEENRWPEHLFVDHEGKPLPW
ncbi:MAG TPA: SDR family NAD(P)-dependent oxidoreductase [Polyangiaceae bacterium]|nr:SDR family NAD(P)-dependent oxidoreductase [Polyangiaceae bacterium]